MTSTTGRGLGPSGPLPLDSACAGPQALLRLRIHLPRPEIMDRGAACGPGPGPGPLVGGPAGPRAGSPASQRRRGRELDRDRH